MGVFRGVSMGVFKGFKWVFSRVYLGGFPRVYLVGFPRVYLGGFHGFIYGFSGFKPHEMNPIMAPCYKSLQIMHKDTPKIRVTSTEVSDAITVQMVMKSDFNV